MTFDELDRKLRIYEKSLDQNILPEIYMAARIDGNRFTRLTKEICQFEAPYDERFRDMMIHTVHALMDYGFRVVYAYTQSDEISLLFHPEESNFGRRVRKYNSILAGVASANFSLELGQAAIFDCRMIPLPTLERVQDYFEWRQLDAHRNALNGHCYWLLRREGLSADEATAHLSGKNNAWKNEFLFRNGINFNDIPTWQKRGVGFYRADIEKTGFNPKTGEETATTRRGIRTDFEIPMGDAYRTFVADFLKH